MRALKSFSLWLWRGLCLEEQRVLIVFLPRRSFTEELLFKMVMKRE